MYVLTDVLEQLWEGEDDLPSNGTDLLKRIGWKVAQFMYDRATSHCNDLHAELSAKCSGERGHVSLNTHTMEVARQVRYPTSGWCLSAINHLEVNNNTASAKYEYTYCCETRNPHDGSRRQHVLTMAQRGRHYDIAVFAVRGHTFYYFGSAGVTAIIRDCDWGLYLDPAANRTLPTNPHYVVELVGPKSASVTYVRYDRTTTKSIVETTFTNCMTRTWNVRTFVNANANGTPRAHFTAAPFGPFSKTTSLHTLVHYNERTMLDDYGDPWLRLESIDSQIAKLVRPIQETTWRNVTLFPRLSKLLTRQLKGRMLRTARKLLLVKAQWREEERAADPVRKCVACAIEAVKGRIGLGMVDSGSDSDSDDGRVLFAPDAKRARAA